MSVEALLRSQCMAGLINIAAMLLASILLLEKRFMKVVVLPAMALMVKVFFRAYRILPIEQDGSATRIANFSPISSMGINVREALCLCRPRAEIALCQILTLPRCGLASGNSLFIEEGEKWTR